MMRRAIIDTGPIVSALDGNDAYHGWTVQRLAELASPLLTCESVLSEAFFLLRNQPQGPSKLRKLLQTGALRIGFSLSEEMQPVLRLMAKYNDLPMSLADGCLVRMSELLSDHAVLTVDRHFLVYRKARNASISTIFPE